MRLCLKNYVLSLGRCRKWHMYVSLAKDSACGWKNHSYMEIQNDSCKHSDVTHWRKLRESTWAGHLDWRLQVDDSANGRVMTEGNLTSRKPWLHDIMEGLGGKTWPVCWKVDGIKRTDDRLIKISKQLPHWQNYVQKRVTGWGPKALSATTAANIPLLMKWHLIRHHLRFWKSKTFYHDIESYIFAKNLRPNDIHSRTYYSIFVKTCLRLGNIRRLWEPTTFVLTLIRLYSWNLPSLIISSGILAALLKNLQYETVAYRGGFNPSPEIPKFWESRTEFPVSWKIHP
jgi:hypothetical protein